MNIKSKIRSISKRTRPNKSEVDNLKCDNSKILKLTNWRSEIDLDEGLKKTIEWIEKNKTILNYNQYF